MITQQAIGCKLDIDVLDALKVEASESGHKVNRIINDALIMYLDWVDICHNIQSGSAPNIEINIYYNKYKNVQKNYYKLQF